MTVLISISAQVPSLGVEYGIDNNSLLTKYQHLKLRVTSMKANTKTLKWFRT